MTESNIAAGATEANPLRQGLPRTRVPDPCAVVLFGATGDLTHRKLVPALFRLAQGGNLPSQYAILGFARRDWSDDAFRADMRENQEKGNGGKDLGPLWPEFAGHLAFTPGSFDDPAAYDKLKAKLADLDRTHGTGGNRLYYLAVAPEYFSVIIERLGKAGLIYPGDQDSPWSRVVIEKPFGHDLASARALNRDVSRVLTEKQVYRIDHYLGKETVQNILALRFGNSIFEPLWNRRHVASVQITVAEEVGMAGGRGAYYDTAGAIRDMVQNHMMQLLCLVAMEPPVTLDADAVRNEKLKVLQALPSWSAADVARRVVRGRYTAGSIEGEEVPGYLEEKGVPPDSRTATYVAMRLTLDTWRWAGVPFYLRTGKRLPKRATEIAVEFRKPPTTLFEPEGDSAGGANVLVLRIQPNEGASLAFQAKIPGSRRRLQEVRMDFRYGTAFASPPPEAYERLLLDVMLGDPTLFTRTDEVESAWTFITQVLEAWEAPDAPPPVNYTAGTWAPPRRTCCRSPTAPGGAGFDGNETADLTASATATRNPTRAPNMAGTTSEDFLSGQGFPVPLGSIETELERLWGPAAEQVGGPDVENPNVTRIVLANLALFAHQADAPRLLDALDTVASRFPSRTIVMQRTEAPGRELRAEISALCHLPAPGLPQVCSERILLCAGPEATHLLPGAVRPILEGELPFILWWTADPRQDEALFRDLADECSRLILDLPDPGTEPAALRLGLDPALCAHARDTAWFGLFRWRELVAQFFDPPCPGGTLARIDRVVIEATAPGAPAALPPRLAVWLAAWLAGQCGWKPEGRPERAPGLLKAAFRGPEGAVAVEIQTTTAPGPAALLATTLKTRAAAGAEPESFRLVRPAAGSPEVKIEICSPSYCVLPRSAHAPEPDPARRVAAALESSRVDLPFQSARPHAFWLLEG